LINIWFCFFINISMFFCEVNLQNRRNNRSENWLRLSWKGQVFYSRIRRRMRRKEKWDKITKKRNDFTSNLKSNFLCFSLFFDPKNLNAHLLQLSIEQDSNCSWNFSFNSFWFNSLMNYLVDSFKRWASAKKCIKNYVC
jgi:hypothetical protein